MTHFTEPLTRAFPPDLAPIARAVVARLPPSRHAPTADSIGPIRIGSAPLHIPSRIYLDPPTHAHRDLSLESRVAACLYTRHHDGYVRERFVRELLPVQHVWEVPFVIQLVGEYVVEIISGIEAGLTDEQTPLFRVFVRENGAFVARTRQRLTSYWDCYYRRRWPRLADYPGMVVLARLEGGLAVRS